MIIEIGKDTFTGLQNLKLLTFAGNHFRSVREFYFQNLLLLENMNLSRMHIEHISLNGLAKCTKLKYLDLSFNRIINLHTVIFQELLDLKKLYMKGNKFDLSKSVLRISLIPDMVYIGSDDGRFCCIAEDLISCDAPHFKRTGCKNLIGNSLMMSYIWVGGILGMGTNAFVIGYRGRCLKVQRDVNHVILLNLAVSDGLTSLYMLAIGTADYTLRSTYITMDHWWRSSMPCFTLAFLHNYAMESSLASLVHMSALYTFVFTQHGKPPMKHCIAVILLSLTVVFIVAMTPLMLIQQVATPMCLVHVESTFKMTGLLVHSIIQHLIVNTALLVISTSCTLKSISTINLSRKLVSSHGRSTGKQQGGKPVYLLVMQLAICFLVWSPQQLVLLAVLCGASVSSQASTWLVIVSFSLSALINPYFFTLRTMKKTKKNPK